MSRKTKIRVILAMYCLMTWWVEPSNIVGSIAYKPLSDEYSTAEIADRSINSDELYTVSEGNQTAPAGEQE